MADPIQPVAPLPTPGATQASPGASVVAAAATTPPLAAAPVPAPAPEVAPAPVPEPVVATAPAATVAEPVAEKPATSLLSEAAKPAEPPKPVEAAKPDPTPAAQPQPLPTYEAFKLPEGLPEGTKLDDARVGEFTKVLGEYENGPKDHASTQAFGQKMVDFHLAELGSAVKTMQESQQQSWDAMRGKWVDAVRNDPELGKNQLETTLARAGDMIEQYGGSAEQKQELRDALGLTGMGDHPALVRLLSNIGKTLGEPTGTARGILTRAINTTPKSARRYAGSTLNGTGVS